jgi:glutamine amidotransferase/cyclase
LEVASEYFRSGADKISIGSDAVYAAEAFLQTGVCIFPSQCSAVSPLYSYFFISGKDGEKQLGADF